MRSFTEYIIDYTEGKLSENDRIKFETELMHNPELKKEYELFMLVNEVMQGKVDIDEVNNDLNLSKTNKESIKLVAEFKNDPTKFSKIQSFVEDSLIGEEEKHLQAELDQINKEIKETNVNSITHEWVNQWNNNGSASNQQEIRSFVTTSLNDKENQSAKKISWYKSSMVRIISLSAAATLAVVFVIRSLIVPVSPEMLYELNYKPYQAITLVTRSSDIDLNNMYNQAIVNYRQGNYEIAALEFDLLMKTDTFRVAPCFFAGLSNIEIGNFGKAINLLTAVTAKKSDYAIEAKWYAGLSYLKIGDKANAIPYFESLSETPGYFQKPSKKILRKLR